MPTVDKTFSFATDAEGLVDNGTHASVTFAFLSSDGNPSGCVRFTCGTKSLTNAQEYGTHPSSGVTWEALGVPAGSTVTNVQLISSQEKLATNSKLSSHSLYMAMSDSVGAAVLDGALLASTALGTTVDSAWQAGPSGPLRGVNASYQASSSIVRLYMLYTITTLGGGGTANVDQRLDEILLRITYTAGATEHFLAANLDLGLSQGVSLSRETFAAANLNLSAQQAAALTRETFLQANMDLTLAIAVNLVTLVEQFLQANLDLGLSQGAALTRETFAAANLPLNLTLSVAVTRETFAQANLDLALSIAESLARQTFAQADLPLGPTITINLTIDGVVVSSHRMLMGVG